MDLLKSSLFLALDGLDVIGVLVLAQLFNHHIVSGLGFMKFFKFSRRHLLETPLNFSLKVAIKMTHTQISP